VPLVRAAGACHNTDMRGSNRRASWRACAALLLVTAPLVLHAQQRGRGFSGVLPPNLEYNGRFTFSRVLYPGGGFRRGGAAWAHDYPDADLNLPGVLAEISSARPNLGRSNVFDLEDPAIFQHPILYFSEPGFWTMTERGARNLRAFLLKGGFAIFDDFEAEQWHNFTAQLLRALPEYRFIELDVSHPVFQSFFALDQLDTPHPLVRVEPRYMGIFEDNDPRRRLMVIANHNNDLAEYWEWSGTGFLPMDPTNGAFKLGINYVIYGLTH
jgi:hypothetical protein